MKNLGQGKVVCEIVVLFTNLLAIIDNFSRFNQVIEYLTLQPQRKQCGGEPTRDTRSLRPLSKTQCIDFLYEQRHGIEAFAWRT